VIKAVKPFSRFYLLSGGQKRPGHSIAVTVRRRVLPSSQRNKSRSNNGCSSSCQVGGALRTGGKDIFSVSEGKGTAQGDQAARKR